jgi:hypothetical protein
MNWNDMDMPQWFYRHCTEAFDLDLVLKDVRDDPEEDMTMRTLASLSVGVPSQNGDAAVDRLYLAVCATLDGEAESEERLDALIGKNGTHYQRAIYETLVDGEHANIRTQLKRLCDLMDARAHAGSIAALRGIACLPLSFPYGRDDDLVTTKGDLNWRYGLGSNND